MKKQKFTSDIDVKSNKSYINNVNNFRHAIQDISGVYFMKTLRGVVKIIQRKNSSNSPPSCYDKPISCQSMIHSNIEGQIPYFPKVEHLIRRRLGPTIGFDLVHFEATLRNSSNPPPKTPKLTKVSKAPLHIEPYFELEQKNMQLYRPYLKNHTGSAHIDNVRWHLSLKQKDPQMKREIRSQSLSSKTQAKK